MLNADLIEYVVGYTWFIGFPIAILLIDSYFKKRNDGNRLPAVFISGGMFYVFGCFFAYGLIS